MVECGHHGALQLARSAGRFMKAVAFTLEGVLCFNVSLALMFTKVHEVEMSSFFSKSNGNLRHMSGTKSGYCKRECHARQQYGVMVVSW